MSPEKVRNEVSVEGLARLRASGTTVVPDIRPASEPADGHVEETVNVSSDWLSA